MEPEGPLSYPQEPTTEPWRKPYEFWPHPHVLLAEYLP
jgi:hypothetical protein